MDEIDEMIIKLYRKAISEAHKPPKYLRDYNTERIEDDVFSREKEYNQHASYRQNNNKSIKI